MIKQIYYAQSNRIFSNKLTEIEFNILEHLPNINFDKNWKLSLVSLTHIKIGYFCLISSILLKYICLGNTFHKHVKKMYKGSSRFCRILAQLLLFILLINFLLIGIVNPSLLNPGPNSLNVCDQNVQGLIPFSQ